MSRLPAVSVCLRVYDGEAYLGAAIESVLRQTFRDFELVIVDDGSRDRSAQIAAGFDDPRLRIVTIPHAGLSTATAVAVAHARGALLAIMDADDVALEHRLAEQVRAFARDANAVVVGSDLTIVDTHDRIVGRRTYPRDDRAIRRALLAYNPFAHPSVMLRTEALRSCGSYSSRFETVEDYELYFRLLRLGTGHNVPEALLRYRVHPGSVKSSKAKRQLRETIELRRVAKTEYGWTGSPLVDAIDLAERLLLTMPPALINALFERAFYRAPAPAVDA